jgi:hypothetical protein
MSTTVDVSDSLEEARTRLLKTARALNGAWAAALCSMVMLVVASLGLLLVAVTIRPVYVVIWSVILAATGYNLTRFWPRRRQRPGQLLTAEESATLRDVLDPDHRVLWPETVRLVPRPELELAEGELVLGMPLLACLDRTELLELLLVAALQASVEDERSVRWALRVAHGDIGRPLVTRRTHLTWLTSRLTEGLRARAAQLDADLGNWAGACERAAMSQRRSSVAIATRNQIAEAWALLRTEWLAPAFDRGRRHAAPFTGLRQFVEGADAAGWLKHRRPWWPPSGVIAGIVSAHEEAVALELDDRGERLRPITWEQHPEEVTIPHWRSLVTEVLDAARRTTGDPAVTLESVLALMESGDAPVLAATTAAGRGLGLGRSTTAYGEWSERFVSRSLSASIGIAAIDSSEFRPTWSWPEGAALVADDGWTLPLESMVAEVLGMVREGDGLDKAYAELREALEQLGIDVHEPLWLDHDSGGPKPERPVGSFTARQGLAARAVVVTDRALHVFRDVQGRRVHNPERPAAPRDASVELRRRMLTVWQGDTTDQVLALTADDVRRARLGPATGGLWWRLTLTCADGTVVLRGRGDGIEEEAEVKEWLGDRVETVWMHSPPAVRNIRNAVGLGGMSLGTLALLWGVLLTITGPAGMPDVLPSVLALSGFGALLVALAPDWALELKRRTSRARVSS